MHICKSKEFFLKNDYVELEPANRENVKKIIEWTLDSIAQGQFKKVPNMTELQLEELFLNSLDRFYFLIRDSFKNPIGRFYFRAWKFDKGTEKIDWELNIFIANPLDRGKGYGSAVQSLALEYLRRLGETNTIFAYTMLENLAERIALEKAGFTYKGILPSEYYTIKLDHLEHPEEFCLYIFENSR